MSQCFESYVHAAGRRQAVLADELLRHHRRNTLFSGDGGEESRLIVCERLAVIDESIFLLVDDVPDRLGYDGSVFPYYALHILCYIFYVTDAKL